MALNILWAVPTLHFAMRKNLMSIVLSIALLILSVSLIFAGNRVYAASISARPLEIAQNINYQITTWKAVNVSLTSLLNDNWKVIAQNTYRAAVATTPGNGAFDETGFNITLQRNNKYVTCFILNPIVGENVSSGCRALN
jgi:hypothetical protein